MPRRSRSLMTLTLVLAGWALSPAVRAQPANDAFASAPYVTSGYTDGPIAITNATTEAGESLTPSCAPAGISKSVWYVWQPSGGQLTVRVATQGSTYDTVLVVYNGFTLNGLTEVSCDDDGGPGLTSIVSFPKGTADDFYFQIGRKNGTADGDLEFQFDFSNCGNSIVELAEECDDQTTGTCCTTECEARPEGSTCTDLDVCTGIGGLDLCDDSANCIPGPPDPCDDGNECTTNQCAGNPIGCRNIPMAGPCEDGNLCTTGDTCDTDFGTCTPGTPVLADADTDGICDPGDNCPFVSNEDQTQSDILPAGDACQCGDLDTNGIINDADVTIARRVLVGSSLAAGAPRIRCNVTGVSDGGIDDCDVQDIAQLARHAGGSAAQIENVCDAYLNP
jgi:hypothetical protein